MQTNLVRELAKALAEAPPDAPNVILDVLRDLRDNPEPPSDEGICGYVEEYANADGECEQEEAYQAFWEDTRRVFFQTWPDRSGDLVFPVSIADGRSPKDQFQDAVGNGTIWDGEYGESRKGLLLYLVEEYAGLLKPGHAAHFKHNQPEEVGEH